MEEEAQKFIVILDDRRKWTATLSAFRQFNASARETYRAEELAMMADAIQGIRLRHTRSSKKAIRRWFHCQYRKRRS